MGIWKKNIKFIKENDRDLSQLINIYKELNYNQYILKLFEYLLEKNNTLLLRFYSDYIFQCLLLESFSKIFLQISNNSKNETIGNYFKKCYDNIKIFNRINFKLNLLNKFFEIKN